MKNFLILGLLALLLFSVSAALSVWLNQSKPQAETDKGKEEKVAAKEPLKDTKDPHKDVSTPHPVVKPPEGPSGGSETTARELRDQQDKLVRRAAQIEVVVRDLQTQREATETTLRQVMSELGKVSTETAKLDALADDLKKQWATFEAGEKKPIERLAAMYDAMDPEAAGPIFKQMADTGKIDLAAKILAQMKDRKAASVLAAMNDSALALAIVEKMRNLRPPPPPPPPGNGTPITPPINGTPVVPARGP
jgi:flagellar motility protein MotE (MotC chaperone)